MLIIYSKYLSFSLNKLNGNFFTLRHYLIVYFFYILIVL